MITTTYQLSNACSWHLGIFLGKIHGHLTYQHIITLSRTAKDTLLTDAEMIADFVQNVINRQWLVIDFHCPLVDPLRKTLVFILIINDAICQQ